MTELNQTPQIPPEERNAGAIVHLLAIGGYFFGIGQLLVPVVMWILYRDKSTFVTAQAREALNFHIGMTVGLFISTWLMYVLIGFVSFAILVCVIIYAGIRAASKASSGDYYRYPMTIRFFN